MPTPKRQLGPCVIDRLIDTPYRFTFIQALRLLLHLLRENGVPYEKAFTHVLRFQNSLSLNFPASEIEALIAAGHTEARTATMLRLALQQDPSTQIRITPAFVGFLGPCGALPYHYSERIAATLREDKNAGARAFVDMISNCVVGLFYEAWGKYRLEQAMETKGQDLLQPRLLALGGSLATHFDESGQAGGVRCELAAYYAALMATRPVSANSLARVLAEYFSVPVGLEDMVGSWATLPENLRSTLGGGNFKLGYGATLGQRQWLYNRRVRVNIGPLDEQQVERFLPRGDGAAALETMLALFGVGHREFEARLILAPSCIGPFTLNTRAGAAKRRLGWNTFLITSGKPVPKPEVRYMLRPS